jgi:hypothetical protein
MVRDQAVVTLEALVGHFAEAIVSVDSRGPIAVRQTTGVAFPPGIGPHTETATVALVMEELKRCPEIGFPGCGRSNDFAHLHGKNRSRRRLMDTS